MEIRVTKWGNSQGVRLPKTVLEEAHLMPGDALEVRVVEGAIVLTRTRPEANLEQLLSAITPQNRHHETPTGPAVGQETW